MNTLYGKDYFPNMKGDVVVLLTSLGGTYKYPKDAGSITLDNDLFLEPSHLTQTREMAVGGD